MRALRSSAKLRRSAVCRATRLSQWSRAPFLADLHAKLVNGSGQDLQVIRLLNDREAIVNRFLRLVAIGCREQDRDFRMMLSHDTRELQAGDAPRHKNV